MNNPFAKPRFVDKITINKKGKKEEDHKYGHVATYFIGMNNAVPICAQACACCWNKPIPEKYEDMAEYVAKRTRTGHTSIIEHSNFIVMVEIWGNEYTKDLIKFLSWTHYLQTTIVEDDKIIYLLVYGSFRGYADLYKETDDLNNAILKSITGVLYNYGNSAMFEDICKLGILDKTKFANVEFTSSHLLLTDFENSKISTELFDIIGIDSLEKILANINHVNPNVNKKLSTFDLLKMGTVTILFKNMSRTSTHQLVRHRNSITQESQRYVDYSDACFNSPALFKPEKYDPDHKYRITIGNSGVMEMTLQEIGDAMCKVYSQLHNSTITGANYALMKEDARAFLPSNVQCKKIYITFTYKSLFKFLELREDTHAQAEIRKYATAIGKTIRNILFFKGVTDKETKETCEFYLNPKILCEESVEKVATEDEGIVEEVIPTVDDYIKASGLDNSDDENQKEENHND